MENIVKQHSQEYIQKLLVKSKLSTSFQVISFFAINTVGITSSQTLSKFFLENPNIYFCLFFLFSAVKPTMLALVSILDRIENIKTLKFEKKKLIISKVLKTILIGILRYKEFLLYQLKILIFIGFLVNPQLQKSYSNYLSIGIIIWILVDILLSLTFIWYKVKFFRSYIPRECHFSKTKGDFEQILFACTTISTLCVSIAWIIENKFMRHFMSFVGYFMFIIPTFVYYREEPYYHEFTSNLFSFLMPSFLIFNFSLLFSMSHKENFMVIFSLMMFFGFSIIFGLKKSKRKKFDFFENLNKYGTLSYIRKRLAENEEDNEEIKLAKEGTIQKFILNSKSRKYSKNLWRKYLTEKNLNTPHHIDEDIQALKEELEEKAMYEEDDERGFQFALDMFLIKRLHEQDIRDNYFIFLRILILLKNKPNIHELLQNLNLMKKIKGMENEFFFKYSLRKIYDYFEMLYNNKKIFFRNIDSANRGKERLKVNLKEDLRVIFNKRSTLSDALVYKDLIGDFSEKLEKFSENNKKLIQLLQQENLNLKSVDIKIHELYHLSILISYNFAKIERRFNGGNLIHVQLYQNFLTKCVNMRKTAREYEKLMRSRIEKKSVLDDVFSDKVFYEFEKEIGMKNKIVVLLVNSSSEKMGIIESVFGESGLKRFEISDLKGNDINELIPEGQRKAHKVAVQNLLCKPFSRNFAIEKNSFLRLGNSKYIHSIRILNKILPFRVLEEDLLMASAFMLRKNDDSYYIMLDESYQITSISYNFSRLLECPLEDLKSGKIHLRDLNKDIFLKMKNFNKEARRRNTMVSNMTSVSGRTTKSYVRSNLDRSTGIEEEYFLGEYWISIANTLLTKFDVHFRNYRYQTVECKYILMRLVLIEEGNALDMEDKTSMEKLRHRNRAPSRGFISKFQAQYGGQEDADIDIVKETDTGIQAIKVSGPTLKLRNLKSGIEATPQKKSRDSSQGQTLPVKISNEEEEKIEFGSEKEEDEEKSKLEQPLKSERENAMKKLPTTNIAEKTLKKKILLKENYKSISDETVKHESNPIYHIAEEKKRYLKFENIIQKGWKNWDLRNLKFLLFASIVLVVSFTAYLGTEYINTSTEFTDEINFFDNFNDLHCKCKKFYGNILLASSYFNLGLAQTRYENFLYNEEENSKKIQVGNLETYLDHKFESTSESFKNVELKNILNSLKILEQTSPDCAKFIFNEQMNFKILLPNNTLKMDRQTFYQSILDLCSRIIEFDGLDRKDFFKGNIDTFHSKIQFFEVNMMNGVMMGFMNFKNKLILFLTEKNLKYGNKVLIFGLLFSFLILTLTFISIFLVIKIRKKIKMIFESFGRMGKIDSEGRIDVLDKFTKSIRKLKESDFSKIELKKFEMNTRSNHKKKDNFKRKKERRILKGKNKTYCFRMMFPIFTIITFFILQSLVALFMIYQLKQVSDARIEISTKTFKIHNLVGKQLMLLSAIKQFLTLGPMNMIMGGKALDYIKDIEEEVQFESSNIRQLSESITNCYFISGFLEEHFSKLENKSLCEVNHDLEDFQEICNDMDNGIPSKGYIQSHFRVLKFLRETVTRIENSDGGKESRVNIMEDFEFRTMEFMIENVYSPSFMEIACHFVEESLEFLENNSDSMASIFTYIFVCSTFFGCIFVINGFSKIWQRLDETIFGFQLLGIDEVIQNAKTRVELFKVFGMKSNYKI